MAASLILAYWALYAIVAPVTVWDSHTYNLARLLLAERGGLFGNELWNDHRQQSFVWAFDAVHYPLLKIAWGVALPSFLCFVGVLVVVFLISRECSPTPPLCKGLTSSNELTRPKCSKGTSHRLIEAAERFGLSGDRMVALSLSSRSTHSGLSGNEHQERCRNTIRNALLVLRPFAVEAGKKSQVPRPDGNVPLIRGWG